MTELEKFCMQGWGRCPHTGVDLNLPLSRVCPLVSEVNHLLREPTGTPSFLCAEHNRGTCPAADRIITLALDESYRRDSPLSRQDVLLLVRMCNDEVKRFVNDWLNDVGDVAVPFLGRMVMETIKAADSIDAYRAFLRTIPHDNQLKLYELLTSNDRR